MQAIRTTHWTIAIVVLVLVAGLAPPVQSAKLKLQVTLRELEGGRYLSADVRLEAADETVSLVATQRGQYVFDGSIGTDGFDSYQIAVEPPEQYVSRTVRIIGDKYREALSGSLKFYLVKQDTFSSYAYATMGLRHFDVANYDGALAHYEAAVLRSSLPKVPGETQVSIKRKRNYARALHNTCVYLEYDTCRQGLEVYRALEGLYGANRANKRIFAEEGIEPKQLANEREDLEVKLMEVKYRRIETLYSSSRFLEAGRLAGEALRELKADPAHEGRFSRLKMTADTLRRDAGNSYLKASESLAARVGSGDRVVCEHLETARAFFEEMSQLDPVSRRNLSIIKTRLGQCG